MPENERAKAVFFGNNYGEAAAIDYFGPSLGLPSAISGHNQYGYWGPRGYSGDVVVSIGFTQEFLRESFDDVQLASTVSPLHAMPEETNLHIYICRKPKAPLAAMWPRFKYLQ